MINVELIESVINNFISNGKKVFVSSSFQTHSIPLLHIISEIDRDIPIYFIETGFHFPETIEFRESVIESMKLNVISQKSQIPKSQQLNSEGRFYFTSDTDYCCYLNKVLPLERILINHDVWISGLRADQSVFRENLTKFDNTGFDCIKYMPLIEYTSKELFQYKNLYDLPTHPLEKYGYLSIGCEPCTHKYLSDSERSSRWHGQNKVECGMHTISDLKDKI